MKAYGGYFGGPEIPDRSFTIADYVVSYYNLQNGLILYRFEKREKTGSGKSCSKCSI